MRLQLIPCLVTAFLSAGAFASAEPLSTLKPRELKAEASGANKRAAKAAEGFKFATGEASLTLEGAWSDDHKTESPLPALVLHLPFEAPAGFAPALEEGSLIRIEPLSGGAALPVPAASPAPGASPTPVAAPAADGSVPPPKYVLHLPLVSAEGGEAELPWKDIDGKPVAIELSLEILLSGETIVTDPVCDSLGLALKPEGDNPVPGLFVIRCSAEGEKEITRKVSVHPYTLRRPTQLVPQPTMAFVGDASASEEDKSVTLSWSIAPPKKEEPAPVAEGDKAAPPPPPPLSELKFAIKGDGKSIAGRYVVTISQSMKIGRWFAYGQVSWMSGFQSGGGQSSTIELAWTPRYPFNRDWNINGHVGFGLFGEKVGGAVPVATFSVLGSYRGLSALWLAEAGVGLQMWLGHPVGTNPIFTVQGARLFPKKIMKVIDRVNFGYSLLSSSLYPAHEFRIGAGLAF